MLQRNRTALELPLKVRKWSCSPAMNTWDLRSPKGYEAGTKALKNGAREQWVPDRQTEEDAYLELEERLADFLGKACHVSSAGYLSCMSSITGFAQRGDIVLVDKNMHSSVWDGIGFPWQVERFSHNRPEISQIPDRRAGF